MDATTTQQPTDSSPPPPPPPKKSSHPSLSDLASSIASKLSLSSKPPPPPPPRPPRSPPMKRPPESPVARLLAKSHILDDSLAAALSTKLPDTLKGYNLKLLYSLQQHGADPGTFYARAQFDARTLIAIQTTRGEVFGGYMTMPWRPSEEYYGTGQSFLWRKTNKCDVKRPGSLLRGFSSSPRQKRVTNVEVYGWTGTNSYFALCSDRSVAMGGGGSFGFLVEEDFSRGTSGVSETYNNPPLSLEPDFEVVNFECWGFTTCMTVDELQRESPLRARPVVKAQAQLRR